MKRLEKVTALELTTALKKSETIIFRVDAETKRQAKALASSMGLSLSEYFTRLHAFAHAKLKPRK